jgi:hypothetical protein
MWDPRRLTTLWASTACYRDTFTLLCSGGEVEYFTMLHVSVMRAYCQRRVKFPAVVSQVAKGRSMAISGRLDRKRKYMLVLHLVRQDLDIWAFKTYCPYFGKIKVGLWIRLAVYACLCAYHPRVNFWMPKTILMKLGMYIVAADPISAA